MNELPSHPEEYALSPALWQASAPSSEGQDSLVANVYETLWKQIVEGEREQGERLIAGEIARELGVSRTPIQQALYQLHRAGLVNAAAGRGFHVAIFSATDIRDLYDLRTVLEVAATRLAAERVSDQQLQEALDTIAMLRKVPETEAGARFLRSDVAFHHELIAGNSGNRRLAEAIANQRAQMSLFLVGGTRVPGGITSAIDEHEQIVRALLARDVGQAVAAVELHIQRVKDDALRYFATSAPRRVRRFLAAQ